MVPIYKRIKDAFATKLMICKSSRCYTLVRAFYQPDIAAPGVNIIAATWKNGPSGSPIFAHGASQKLADPFDLGGGVVNPNKAANPGKPTMCVGEKPSILDVNVPSITIPSLGNSTTITRTVTNVGGATKSIYKAAIEPPLGILVSVNPEVLVFDAATKKISYRVTVSTTYQVNTGFFFGSLTWTNGVHAVRIPISVKTEIMPTY
ncbi:hypothetical protein EZV62_022079 [Acer yangbiense]|uniref:Subtilisin-like protease fibronectin type-III domain-containing protein n=1 Tax=Acer yangbiense TaxID=1000413 RepID=A0A5C7H7G6_9ROSI|nr:hypothetical protein EZV62_022079 [Acer yangbiense]